MARRPTFASVTSEPCTCKYLQKAAEDPDNPIEFDERTKGYLYTYADYQGGEKATLIIYHCPFCGGVAP